MDLPNHRFEGDEDHPEHHEYHYSVDGEAQVSPTKHRTVRVILETAGVDPSDHYLVQLRGHEKIEYKDLEQVISLHEHERFVTVYNGPTPVS